MKNFILILIFILWISYYYIPNDTKIDLFQKVWINATFIKKETIQEPIKWEVVKLYYDKNRVSTYSWDITYWKIIDNSLWASGWNVKCFYENDYNNFDWNVMLHKIYLSKNKTAVIKLTTINPETQLSLYVYKTTANNDVYPPEIQYVHDCKKDFSTPSTKTIEIKWNTAPSDIVIWVTGMNGLLEWWYTLEIQEK